MYNITCGVSGDNVVIMMKSLVMFEDMYVCVRIILTVCVPWRACTDMGYMNKHVSV